MAAIVPIKGLRYNQNKITNIADVLTPPYDVIDPVAQQLFYDRHPYNIIRLELGKTYADDDTNNNRYTRAAKTFRQWWENGILVQDDKPSIYLYQQQFTVQDKTYTRTGFICGLQCEEYAPGAVLPHEETLPKAKEDRKKLMEACHANFSCIFGLYDEPEMKVQSLLLAACKGKKPDYAITDGQNVTHLLWAIQDQELIAEVQRILADKTVYIADGHHRYETALAHAEEMRALGNPGYEHVMVTLVNLHDEGLVILPTHRLLKNIPELNMEQLLHSVADYFEIEKIAATEHGVEERLSSTRQTSFVLYPGGEEAYQLTLKGSCKPETLHGHDKSVPWRQLDVSILHSLILEKHLGIGSAQRASGKYLAYTRDAQEALTKVQSGEYQLAVFMKPTKVEQVIAVAAAGDKMPQKSTYFYPKLITGLVINPLGIE
ncbi:MAG: DUF1015 domain-containing protein [Thermoanaerobacteraceae bacterium]|nr:DUF1015 domain-containing protein [Thermoanaerobacteraceae bacterium]